MLVDLRTKETQKEEGVAVLKQAKGRPVNVPYAVVRLGRTQHGGVEMTSARVSLANQSNAAQHLSTLATTRISYCPRPAPSLSACSLILPTPPCCWWSQSSSWPSCAPPRALSRTPSWCCWTRE